MQRGNHWTVNEAGGVRFIGGGLTQAAHPLLTDGLSVSSNSTTKHIMTLFISVVQHSTWIIRTNIHKVIMHVGPCIKGQSLTCSDRCDHSALTP